MKKIGQLFLCAAFLLPALVWAQNKQVIINVQGMTCPLCVSMINKALRETQGVIKATTSLPKHEATVIVPEAFEVDALLAAIEQTGYTGEVKSVQPTE